MCTLSWLWEAEGYQVFFNRDELRERLPARGPARGRREGVDYLAPRDGDAGGAWLGVNALGLTLAVHNRSPLESLPEGREWWSRGQLLLSLLAAGSADDVRAALLAVDLDRLRPFTLLVFAPRRALLSAAWDRRELSFDRPGEGAMPLCSSAFDEGRAAESKRALWRRWARRGRPGPSDHLAWHQSHEPERGPYSVCMHREGASTVSFSRVVVGPERVEFHYHDGPPCQSLPWQIERLARA